MKFEVVRQIIIDKSQVIVIMHLMSMFVMEFHVGVIIYMPEGRSSENADTFFMDHNVKLMIPSTVYVDDQELSPFKMYMYKLM